MRTFSFRAVHCPSPSVAPASRDPGADDWRIYDSGAEMGKVIRGRSSIIVVFHADQNLIIVS
jgi:hypothetical protein